MSAYSTLGITRDAAIQLINRIDVSDMPNEVLEEVLFAIYRRYTLNNFRIEDQPYSNAEYLKYVDFKDPSYD